VRLRRKETEKLQEGSKFQKGTFAAIDLDFTEQERCGGVQFALENGQQIALQPGHSHVDPVTLSKLPKPAMIKCERAGIGRIGSEEAIGIGNVGQRFFVSPQHIVQCGHQQGKAVATRCEGVHGFNILFECRGHATSSF